MRKPLVLASSFLVTTVLAASASATTYYVSPTGTATTDCTARETACDINSGATIAMAGDTVVLMDGTYTSGLYPANSGTSDAWITFQADDCSMPIIQGVGVDPLSDNQDSGVYSKTSTYVRFVGIIVRGFSTGFGNGWTGTDTTTSNGNWEIKNCIADSNGRTGMTFFSAQGIHIQNSIAAHNGSSIMESWSSGITLYEAQGGAGASLIEGNISFENMDNHDVAQSPNEAGKHSDGNGFIIDEYSNGATFVNNVAFGNGGSCLRLTKSSNAKFINNTCYHNARDTRDAGPSNPGEVYFTDDATRMGVTMTNNVFVATGSGPGATAIYGKPSSGYSNNVEKTGSVSYFTGAEGNNPDFTLASGATDLVGKGMATSGAPTNDVGFDPKCIVKKAPTAIGMMTSGSWWSYSVDYDYIKSIGGVAKCWSPKTRSGTLDMGAYSNGAVTTAPQNTCKPPVVIPSMGMGGMGSGTAGTGSGAGGMAQGSGGTSPAAGAPNVAGMSSSAGGAPGAGGTTTGTGGAATTGGSSSTTGGTSSATGGSTSTTGGTSPSGAGTGPTSTTGGTTSNGTGGSSSPGTGGASSGSAGSAGSAGSDNGSASGCGCRVAGESSRSASLAGLGLFALALVGLKRRRAARVRTS